MTDKKVYPVWRYHATKAPDGQLFQSNSMPKGQGWKDKPIKKKAD